MTQLQNVVLVHGGFVDGSGWQGVYDLLRADGFNVSVVQNSTVSLESDVDATRDVLDAQDGPSILVGHSYGGVVISEAGTHENVAALVYIAAFAPDQGESVGSLIADPPPGAPVPPILPPQNGFLFLDRDKFAASFAADVPLDLAAFMADSQVPWGLDALNGKVTDPAWRSKPSWYLVATDDRMIPPPAQRAMAERAGSTTTEAPGSHAIYVSQPAAVADLIKQAAHTLDPEGALAPDATPVASVSSRATGRQDANVLPTNRAEIERRSTQDAEPREREAPTRIELVCEALQASA